MEGDGREKHRPPFRLAGNVSRSERRPMVEPKKAKREGDNFLIRTFLEELLIHRILRSSLPRFHELNEPSGDGTGSVGLGGPGEWATTNPGTDEGKKGSRFLAFGSPAERTKATQVSHCRSTRIRECPRALSRSSLTPLTTFYLKFNPKWGPS